MVKNYTKKFLQQIDSTILKYADNESSAIFTDPNVLTISR